ncbi:MAG: rplA [Gammaproteobacteria bacterium]|jgi:large subunit ribosomal protein L1|nr:rplA [Gammaproteobacteria bacterium]
MTTSKRVRAIKEKLVQGKLYTPAEAFAVLQDMPAVKFIESVDVSVNLGIDVRRDQGVRGSIVLPKGTGRSIRVAVFTSPGNAEAAIKAGADLVGFEDLAEKVKAGEINFDVVIATPDAMRIVGQLGQVLGPRGLMPNPKDGTVTPDVATAVRNVKAGQARYRADKAGIVHCMIGKINFTVDDLVQNFKTLLAALKKAKPNSAKGIYFKKITVSSTMGPGLQIDASSIEAL